MVGTNVQHDSAPVKPHPTLVWQTLLNIQNGHFVWAQCTTEYTQRGDAMRYRKIKIAPRTAHNRAFLLARISHFLLCTQWWREPPLLSRASVYGHGRGAVAQSIDLNFVS